LLSSTVLEKNIKEVLSNQKGIKMRQISKYDLCDSCRKIRPKKDDGSLNESLEWWLDSPGYKGEPMARVMVNKVMVLWLQENSGCNRCINLVQQTQ
jgi:hypothetical protein